MLNSVNELLPISADEPRPTLCVHDVQIPYSRPEDALIITPNIRAAIEQNRFEVAEARFLPALVEPGDRVLELGAGIGVISSIVARQPGVARLIAAEANPHLIPFMARVHALNSANIADRLNAIFTTDGATEKRLYLREDFWMSSTKPGPESYVSTVDVPVFNLNDFAREEGITFIICDIEGAEVDLFRHADLPGVDRILVEVHDHLTGLRGIRELFEGLLARGFCPDPRYSLGSVLLFRRIPENEILRPYSG